MLNWWIDDVFWYGGAAVAAVLLAAGCFYLGAWMGYKSGYQDAELDSMEL